MPRNQLYPLTRPQKVVFFFNVASLTLWFCCFGRFLILLPLVGRRFLPGGIADFFHVVSLLPLIEFVVVKLLVPKPFTKNDFFKFLNAARLAWLCYVVIFPHPKVAKHTSYSLIIAAWCFQYIIHYAYYAFKTKTKKSPQWLFWLQYHNFYWTFPIAIVGEISILFLSLAFVEHKWYDISYQVAVLAYVPGGYFAWNHMRARIGKYDAVMDKRRRGLSTLSEGSSTAVANGAEVQTSN